MLRLRFWVARLGLLLLSLLLVVHFTPLVPAWARLLADEWPDASGDTLIVLAAEVQSDGILGYATYWRCVYAIRVWRTGGFRQVILSGGPSPPAPGTMAASMKSFLVGNGVPAEAILLEERSRSTRENALNTAALLHGKTGRAVLLSTDFHTYRAVRTFRKAGIDVVPRPVPHALKDSSSLLQRWPLFWALSAETVKIVYYRWSGWI